MENLEKETIQKLNDDVLDHMMNPRNYGKLQNATCVGMGVDKKTNEYGLMYLDIKDDKINDVKFGCNACQDTVVAGSFFTEMIKGASLDYAIKSSSMLKEKIKDAPKKQQACTNMILLAFDAALIHKDSNKQKDMHIINLKE